jgi:hypothetical protein
MAAAAHSPSAGLAPRPHLGRHLKISPIKEACQKLRYGQTRHQQPLRVGFVAQQKHEAVSVSFHYLRRTAKQDNGTYLGVPFSKDDFGQLFTSLQSKPTINLNDPKSADKVRFKQDVPLEQIFRVDERTIFGLFKAAYWGHAYENTAKGTIPADSISLRPFHFLLYRSEAGEIFLAAQYLGLFGGYSITFLISI